MNLLRLYFFPILGVIALAACSSPAIVFVAPTYNPTHVHRVAMLSLADYPEAPGSGEIAAATFEKYLLEAGYSVVERRQVAQILKEQSLSFSGAVDASQIRNLGRILGVDALVMGNVTDFSNSREQTVMVDVPQEQSDPIYGRVVTVQQNGNTTVETVQHVITGYSYTQTDQIIPETQTVPAHVGLSIRLVDTQTGEVLWVSSGASDGSNLAAATETASSKIMEATIKKLKAAKR